MTMTSKTVPRYSIYSGDCDYAVCPIRVDSGKFAGTIFIYETVAITKDDDPDMKFSVTAINAVVNGKYLSEWSNPRVKEEFLETARQILIDMLRKD